MFQYEFSNYQYEAFIVILNHFKPSQFAHQFKNVLFCYSIKLLFLYLHTKRDIELSPNDHTADKELLWTNLGSTTRNKNTGTNFGPIMQFCDDSKEYGRIISIHIDNRTLVGSTFPWFNIRILNTSIKKSYLGCE